MIINYKVINKKVINYLPRLPCILESMDTTLHGIFHTDLSHGLVAQNTGKLSTDKESYCPNSDGEKIFFHLIPWQLALITFSNICPQEITS